jgi:hypothetical protein
LKYEKQYGHLAIRHEIYHVPRNRWEDVYLNSRRAGFGATAFEVGKDEGRGERWREAEIVDVRGGVQEYCSEDGNRGWFGRRERYLITGMSFGVGVCFEVLI